MPLAGAASAALTFAAHHELVDARETDEDVHDGLNLHPAAEQLVHDVPVCTAGEPAEADQAPVQGSDRDEEARNHAE